MIKLDVYSPKGEKTGKVSLPEEIFAVPVNQALMSQAVRVYLANQRRAKAKTKRRGEVRGSGAKIWRQKGTGRARHGDRQAGIFRGGGVIHGPSGEENYKLKMSKVMRKKALFSALTEKFKKGQIVALEGIEKIEPKTKELVKCLGKIPLLEVEKILGRPKKTQKILFLMPKMLENLLRAGRNIAFLELASVNLINPYQVLSSGKVVFMPESIKILEETFLKGKKKGKKIKNGD